MVGTARGLIGLALAGFVSGAPLAGRAEEPASLTFTTLGTNSGPIPDADRFEPANLVRYGDDVVLVDVGDGAVDQLARAGVGIGDLDAVVISHLHFDHTGGLFGLLSLRFQSGYMGPLTLYGPPGTKATVDALLAAIEPGRSAVATMRAKATGEPDSGLTVVELAADSKISIGAISITAAENSHYDTLPEKERPLSLSYRFDAPGRSILYTGDTGPSARVETLCKGVDLLVSEIMDPKLAIAHIKLRRPDVPAFAWPVVESHFRKEHLSPEAVGKLATACGAKALVLTHIALERDELAGAREAIAKGYGGTMTFAEDLQTF